MTRFHEHEICFNEGVVLQEKQKHSEAIAYFQKAIEIQDDFIPAWVYQGISLEELQRYEEAIDCYDRAIQINPDTTDLWYNKGATLCRLKRYGDALGCFDKVLEIDPNNALAKTTRELILQQPIILNPTPKTNDPDFNQEDANSQEAEISGASQQAQPIYRPARIKEFPTSFEKEVEE